MRKTKLIIAIIIFVNILGLNSVWAEGDNDGYEILVKYNESKNENNQMYGGQNLHTGIEKLGFKKIRVNTREELNSLIAKLSSDPKIKYVEENIRYSIQHIPNDPYVSSDWGINHVKGQQAWDITVGVQSTIIAVIDTGVDLEHPDLKNKLVEGKNFIDPNMSPQDDNSHGTFVAEVIAAEANNNFGKAGVSWNSMIMPLKALDNKGEGYVDAIAEAIVYAADNGAKIINLSLGGSEDSIVIREAVCYAYNKGVLLVGASGNAYGPVFYPAAYREVMAVGAIGRTEIRANFSNFGKELSLVAPGVQILGVDRDGKEIFKSGTSFAAPYVSGAAALIWSFNPNLTNDQVQWIIESSAKDLGTVGWNSQYGYGGLDIYKSISENIKFFDNVEHKKVMDLFFEHINTMETNKKNLMYYTLRGYFREEDKVEDQIDGSLKYFGIYRLQDELESIIDLAGVSYLDKLVSMGIGSNRGEALEILRESLCTFFDWSISERLLLLDHIKAGRTNDMRNLLIKNKVYNPYIDNNNCLDSAEYLLNRSTTGKFGVTRDVDYYTFNLTKSTLLHLGVSAPFGINLEIFEQGSHKFITEISQSTDINLLPGNYYIRATQPEGRWSDLSYTLEIIEVKSYFGDLNRDGVIDIYDITMLSKLIGSVVGDGRYRQEYDANRDGAIDILDLTILLRNYNMKF